MIKLNIDNIDIQKMKTNPKGFTPVAIILAVIAIFAIVGTGAWYYAQNAKPKPAQPNSAPQQPVHSQSASQSNPQSVPASSGQAGQQIQTPPQGQSAGAIDTTGWQTYNNDQYGFDCRFAGR